LDKQNEYLASQTYAVKVVDAYHALLFSFLEAMTLIEGIAPNALIVRNASRWWQIT